MVDDTLLRQRVRDCHEVFSALNEARRTHFPHPSAQNKEARWAALQRFIDEVIDEARGAEVSTPKSGDFGPTAKQMAQTLRPSCEGLEDVSTEACQRVAEAVILAVLQLRLEAAKNAQQ